MRIHAGNQSRGITDYLKLANHLLPRMTSTQGKLLISIQFSIYLLASFFIQFWGEKKRFQFPKLVIYASVETDRVIRTRKSSKQRDGLSELFRGLIKGDLFPLGFCLQIGKRHLSNGQGEQKCKSTNLVVENFCHRGSEANNIVQS